MSEAHEVVDVAIGEENHRKEILEEKPSQLESRIIFQVEYYFGDKNLPRDKFMQEQLRLNGGWLPVNILPRFNQIAKFTRNPEVIAKALNKSTSGLLEMSDDDKKVRRNPDLPVPEMNMARRFQVSSRTIYAKGFPRDATLDELLNHFKKYDQVENIMMRKFQRPPLARVFKGSVYITFKTREQAEKFMETQPHEYQYETLKLLWQLDYLAQK